jgi:hypothetical protein
MWSFWNFYTPQGVWSRYNQQSKARRSVWALLKTIELEFRRTKCISQTLLFTDITWLLLSWALGSVVETQGVVTNYLCLIENTSNLHISKTWVLLQLWRIVGVPLDGRLILSCVLRQLYVRLFGTFSIVWVLWNNKNYKIDFIAKMKIISHPSLCRRCGRIGNVQLNGPGTFMHCA